MAGEDLDLGDDGGTNDTGKGGKGKKHKPLSKGQKIGVAIGAVTILLIVFQIKKGSSSSSSSTTASAPIDPQTGYPTGSAEDQAALAQISASQSGATAADGGGGSGGYYDSGGGGDSGTDPATGVSYSSEFSTLGAEVTSYQNQIAAWESQAASTFYSSSNPPPSPAPAPTTTSTTSTTTGPTAADRAKLASLNAELTKDTTGANKGSTGAKANIPVLKKQIAAVQAR